MNSGTIPITSLSLIDIQLLDSCVWRGVKFFAKMDTMTVISNGHIYYKCVYGLKKGTEVVLGSQSFRYSAMKELYDHLVSTYKLSKMIPPCPPKHLWGNTYQSVIKERIDAFDSILMRINTFMGINNDEKLCRFFNLDLRDVGNADEHSSAPAVVPSSVSSASVSDKSIRKE